MLRHRHIRFFISSTFEDMEIERNLLRQVIEQLSYKYEKLGWKIDLVDLRWGITNQISKDNRTMRICLEELRRCQNISPKPNFIILSGQRRGWIPLPELLTIDEANYYLDRFDTNAKQLFNMWYKLDVNYLPEPLYELQPRFNEFLDDTIWDEKVYKPLIDSFGDLPSATEREIINGALNVEDSSRHVFLYDRRLTLIPEEQGSKYIDKEQNRIDEFRMQIYESVCKDNIYEESLSYSEYQTEKFKTGFKKEIEKHLTLLIDREIDNYSDVISENEIHNSIAQESHLLFKGREGVISYIDEYINSQTANYALWFRSESGSGKSAVISEVFRLYSASHNVICRFCGETEASMNGGDLLNNIWTEMKLLYPMRNWSIQDLPGYNQSNSRFQKSATQMFNSRLTQELGSKPLLLLIDGMNQLEDLKSNEFFYMKWLDCRLSNCVKVIITSTEDKRINTNCKHIQIKRLEPFNRVDAIGIVKEHLLLHNRSLTEEQFGYVAELLGRNDCLPSFLTILGNYLCRFPSYKKLPELSLDFNELITEVLHSVIGGNKHDGEFVKLALSLIVADRHGLAQDDLLKIMSQDNDFMNHIRMTSYHEISGNEIPPIYWSRLYSDLSYFFVAKHGICGPTITVYHESLSNAIIDKYFKTADGEENSGFKYNIYRLLADYYQAYATRHAVADVMYCNYMAFGVNFVSQGLVNQYADKAIDLIRDPRYLYKKMTLDKMGLMDDIMMAYTINSVSPHITEQQILKLRKDLSHFPACSWKQFLQMCSNLHSESYLRSLMHPVQSDILKDVLSDSLSYDLVSYVSGDSGESTIISNDGRRVLYLQQYRHKVAVEDMGGEPFGGEYTLGSPIIAIDATKDMGIHAFITKNGLQLYDLLNEKTVFTHNDVKEPLWVSISNDGKRVAYGGKDKTWVEGLGTTIGSSGGKLSQSGEYVWLAFQDGIFRYDMKAEEWRHMPIAGIYDYSKNPRIHAASDEMCLLECGRNVVAIYTYLNEDGMKKYSTYGFQQDSDHIKILSAAIIDDMIMFVDDYYGRYTLIRREADVLRIKSDKYTYMYNVDALSHNGEYAYSSYEKRCYKLTELLKTYKMFEAYNVGLNCVASDKTGSLIVVTSGKNEMQEHCKDILIIRNGKADKIKFPDRPTPYFISCAVNPEGTLIWISEHRDKGALICLNKEGKIIKEFPNKGGKVAMSYTRDGKYLIAVRGHYIADLDPVFDIIDENLNIVKTIDSISYSVLSVKSSTEMRLSDNEKYAIIDDKKVVSLDEGRLLSKEEAGLVISQEVKESRFLVDKTGSISYLDSHMAKVEKTAYIPNLCLWVENERGLVVVTQEGKVSMFVP